MITLSTTVCVIILAFIAAIFSQPVSDYVFQSDRNIFLPQFVKSEGFYRAFLINLSFAGITTAATSLYVSSNHLTFWIIRDPMLAIFSNLLMGIVASFTLEVGTAPPKNKSRTWWLRVLIFFSFCTYMFSIWTVNDSKFESNEKCQCNSPAVNENNKKSSARDNK